MVSFDIDKSSLYPNIGVSLSEEQKTSLTKRLYEHLRIYERLDIMSVYDIIIKIDPKCNPYNHYILDRVKEWNGDVTIDVYNMMVSRLKILTFEESKECCRKICIVGCRLAGALLGLEPSKGRVDLHHELSRHRLSTKSYDINNKYDHYYRGDRSFSSFAFSITESAKSNEEKEYAERILCRYVTNKLANIGFKGFVTGMNMFEWEKQGISYDIELPSCIRFTDKFLNSLEIAKKEYIRMMGIMMYG